MMPRGGVLSHETATPSKVNWSFAMLAELPPLQLPAYRRPLILTLSMVALERKDGS